ncbi:hypothetical protein L3N51_01431 [Metallosphaera sp. J1]|uniref:DUF5305 domain-containing protein n=1 Tax=Metallosphaera TaxID=41980 RepID=UPI001EDCBD11|nr:DUF5305 domain-containing protein [Metallosphaera javensis (ex Hofmann et al. 2022)]MCG3109141.1 hypothetical protein [Metallosphaera javensis (ex Hofmann et al. 2022)]BCS93697.1 MAG: hypothetical protein MjAS7_2305 [Metallosphaera javensis (ex Sakai et al. 2022)]
MKTRFMKTRTMIALAICLLFLSVSGTMIYYGYASNVPYYRTYEVPTYSYQAQLNLWSNFHINDSILFDNVTCVNSSTMFSKLVESITLHAEVNASGSSPTSYNGTYVVYEYLSTSDWTKYIGSFHGPIANSSGQLLFFKYAPNITQFNNLTQKINQQVGLSFTRFTIKLVVIANLTLHSGSDVVPVTLEKSMEVYFGSLNYTFSQDPGGNVTQTLYHQDLVRGMTGYNKMLFISGGIFAIFGGVSFVYGPKAGETMNPEAMAERTLRKLSVSGTAPSTNSREVKVESARGLLKLAKTLSRTPVKFDKGYYIIDSDTTYVWNKS